MYFHLFSASPPTLGLYPTNEINLTRVEYPNCESTTTLITLPCPEAQVHRHFAGPGPARHIVATCSASSSTAPPLLAITTGTLLCLLSTSLSTMLYSSDYRLELQECPYIGSSRKSPRGTWLSSPPTAWKSLVVLRDDLGAIQSPHDRFPSTPCC